MQTYRATVRGRFDGLGEEARAALLTAADEHDMFSAAFTEAGTLTYDRALSWFSFRCEVRVSPEEGAEAAEERAGALARRAARCAPARCAPGRPERPDAAAPREAG
ncbi:hypothetical protein J0910_17445 [Nocardiopsis sp. CNT-189]|uniref:DUF6204 family protein n=1 Tax=Nocardiopsis oceanisediminis TaxID=2816862 RepID=UPI003B302B92